MVVEFPNSKDQRTVVIDPRSRSHHSRSHRSRSRFRSPYRPRFTMLQYTTGPVILYKWHLMFFVVLILITVVPSYIYTSGEPRPIWWPRARAFYFDAIVSLMWARSGSRHCSLEFGNSTTIAWIFIVLTFEQEREKIWKLIEWFLFPLFLGG